MHTGAVGYPANDLTFSTSAFSDPQGSGTFAAVQWRIGEIYYDGVTGYVMGDPYRYEIEEVYTSAEINNTSPFTFPVIAARPGLTYRARVRHLDTDGNWGHWSDAIEFSASAPDVTLYQSRLVISEFLYHPAPVSSAEATLGFTESDFEWIEIQNVSILPVDMTGVRFTKGIDFNFPDNYTIQPGGYAVLPRNAAAFAERYGAGIPTVGQFAPDSLSNGGENIKLSLGAGTAILDFTYDDNLPWPTDADGVGYSLVLVDPESLPDHNVASNWRTSTVSGGNPANSDATTFTGDPTADADADGWSRLLEYALGTSDAASNDVNGVFSLSTSSGFVDISISRNLAADDVTIAIYKSDDLNTWVPATDLPLISEVTQGDGTSQLSYRSTAPYADGVRCFYRVQVSMNAP
jgi:hypothetical protein